MMSEAPAGSKPPDPRSYPRPRAREDLEREVRVCPPYMIDTAPGGGGLGVRALTAQDEDEIRDHVYVGGPAG